MKRIAKTAAAASTVLASLGLLATKVAASSYSYSTTADDTLGATFCFGNMIFTVCCGLISLVLFAFTIWMLIDVIKRDEKVLPGKIKWLLVILLVPFGSVVYYFMRKRKMD